MTPCTNQCSECDTLPQTEFGDLGPEEFELLSARGIMRSFKRGEFVFYQGFPPAGLYFVRSGTVAIQRVALDGTERIVRIVEAGQTLGHRAFFSGGLYSAHAFAVTNADLCFQQSHVIHKILDSKPDIYQKFVRRLASELADAERFLTHMTELSVANRIINALIGFEKNHGKRCTNGKRIIVMPVKRQDLGSMIGARPESVSRALKDLRNSGVIKISGRSVHVLDDEQFQYIEDN